MSSARSGATTPDYLLGGDPPAGVVQLRYRYGVWWDAEDCHVEDVSCARRRVGAGSGRRSVARRSSAPASAAAAGSSSTPRRRRVGAALYRSLGFRSGGDEPGRLAVFMRRRIDPNVPPGWG